MLSPSDSDFVGLVGPNGTLSLSDVVSGGPVGPVGWLCLVGQVTVASRISSTTRPQERTVCSPPRRSYHAARGPALGAHGNATFGACKSFCHDGRRDSGTER